MRLALSKETLAELTADDLSAVVGGGEESNSCSIASCVTTLQDAAVLKRLTCS